MKSLLGPFASAGIHGSDFLFSGCVYGRSWIASFKMFKLTFLPFGFLATICGLYGRWKRLFFWLGSAYTQTSGYSELCILWVHFPVLNLSTLMLCSLSSASHLLSHAYLYRAFLITIVSKLLFHPFSTSIIYFLFQEDVSAPSLFHNLLPVP